MASYGNSDAITQEELKVYDYFLASDQLEGRNFPSRGYDTAALYVASHLAEWGLKPGGSTSGTNGPLQPYFMPMEMVTRQVVPEESKASLVAPAGGRGATAGGLRTTNFEYAKDWNTGGVFGPPTQAFEVSGNMVFVGNGYVLNKTNINPYEGLDVRGKIVVTAGVPAEMAAQQGGGGRGRGAPAAWGENCVDYFTPVEAAAKNGAVAVVTIANFQTLTAMANPTGGRGPSPNGPNAAVVKFQTAGACPAVPSVNAGLEMTNALFLGEKINASQVFYGTGGATKLDSFVMNAQKKLDLHVSVHSEPGHGENVVGIIEGSDPVLKNEYVVISAHLDHIGLSAPLPDGHNVNNGADDDGSGSTGLLGIAHAYADGAAKGMRPKRTRFFLECRRRKRPLGLAILQRISADRSQQGCRRPEHGYDRPHQEGRSRSIPIPRTCWWVPVKFLLVGPNISSDDLEKTIETVNNGYQKLTLNHFYDATAPDATHDNLGPQPNGQRIFYRSDHYNFAKMGFPSLFSPTACTWIITAPRTRRRKSTSWKFSKSRKLSPPWPGYSATSGPSASSTQNCPINWLRI